MRVIELAADAALTVEPDVACRLAEGCVDLSVEEHCPPVRFHADTWDFFYWGMGQGLGAEVRSAGGAAKVELYAQEEVMAAPAGYSRLIARTFEHALLLRLNLFSHERHVRQVLKYYFEQYKALYIRIAEDVTQQQLSILQKDIDIKEALRESDSRASNLAPRDCNLGNTVIFSRESDAQDGVYVVRTGEFYLLLDDVEVLSFERDQVVYLPAEVIHLPGYMSSNFANLQKVAENPDDFVRLLQNCPRVAERFIRQYSGVIVRLLRQSAQIFQHCQSARKKIHDPESAGESLHGFLEAIARFTQPDSFLAGYAGKVKPLLNDTLLAAGKLQEEENALFHI